MKIKILKTVIISFVLMALMSFVEAEKWFSFESKEFNFKIEFPKEPTSRNQVLQTEIGELKMNMFIYDASKEEGNENRLYSVNYTEYPDSLVNSDNVEMLPIFYRNSIDGAVSNVKGKVLSEKNYSVRKLRRKGSEN